MCVAGSACSDRVTTETAAIVVCRWSTIGAASDVIASGTVREVTA
jgi:hypothetical protein